MSGHASEEGRVAVLGDAQARADSGLDTDSEVRPETHLLSVVAQAGLRSPGVRRRRDGAKDPLSQLFVDELVDRAPERAASNVRPRQVSQVAVGAGQRSAAVLC